MRVVVLGSGWGGFRVVQSTRLSGMDKVTCVSTSNCFLFTPLLPTTTTGTLELRTITEPITKARSDGRLEFFHAEATRIDTDKKIVTCKSFYDVAKSDEDRAGRFRPEFEVPYDKLVIATGARAATFGIPGAQEFTFPLRKLGDARIIRHRLIEVFERASSPFCSDEEKKRLLSFVIVGGGPTSVEFAAELYDFLNMDVKRLFPQLGSYTRVTMVEASGRVLGSFSRNLSDYTMKLFASRNINLMMGVSVKEVHQHSLMLSNGQVLPFGMCVWSTGNEMIPFIKNLPFDRDQRTGRLLVDEYLRVSSPCKSVYAIGDCAMERTNPLPATAQVANQQAKWLSKHLDGRSKSPFQYAHAGMLAYVGGGRALVDLPFFRTSGFFAWMFWNSAYLNSQVSWKNRLLIPATWLKARVFGRDVVSFEDKPSWVEEKD